MNKKNIDWNDLQLFLAVAREGGLSAAVKSTQRSAATLGRRMHALERGLGKELFIRHDKGYELQAEGKALLKELSEIEEKIVNVTTPLTSNAIRPLVKVSAGTWTTLYLIENLNTLMDGISDIRLRFVSTEKVLDITHREVVIGIRNQRPTEETLVCRRLKKVEFAPYSTPNAPDVWIKVLADIPSARWLDKHVGNNTVCEVNEPRNSLDLALAGNGIALLPTFVGDSQATLVRRGNIVEGLGHNQWLVTHQDDRHLPEVRSLIDRLGKVLE